ncbi:restriction endonuclease subunit S [Spiroplasma endosymbiont of Polydrusus pterygomalis]|uniref:restriction endonuclease subunit S n=1 Tax=Spiroplasma endosymbiont of Polydrusus pterygomalis TaxID=3139327 RepID=UPI003CCADDF0
MEYKILKIAKIYGGSTPSTKSSIFWKQEIPFITPNFLTKNYNNFIYYSDRYITDLNYNYAYKNDIFITCRAPVGIVKINKLDKCYFSQGIKRIVPNKKIVKHKFLFYWFIKNKKVLLKYSNGSTYLEISKYNLEQIKINLPELIVQQRIIDIIEPFEKLAEIYEKLIKLINNLFSLITKLYSLQTKEKLLSYFNWELSEDVYN